MVNVKKLNEKNNKESKICLSSFRVSFIIDDVLFEIGEHRCTG